MYTNNQLTSYSYPYLVINADIFDKLSLGVFMYSRYAELSQAFLW